MRRHTFSLLVTLALLASTERAFAPDEPLPQSVVDYLVSIHHHHGNTVGIGCLPALEGADIPSIYLHNAAVPALQYGQVTYRSLADISPILGPDFSRFVDGLAVPSEILLTGGGYGLYGWDLFNKGHRLQMINSQNFYNEHLARLASDRDRIARNFPREIEGTTGRFYTVGAIPIALLNRLFRTFGVGFPSGIRPPEIGIAFPSSQEYWQLKPGVRRPEFLTQFFGALQNLAGSLAAKANRSGRYRLLEDIIQTGLDTVPDNSIHLALDFMDGVYYSSHRPQLYSKIYRKLAPGGRAYILAEGIADFVNLLPGEAEAYAGIPSAAEGWVLTTVYFSRRFSDVFRFEQVPFAVDYLRFEGRSTNRGTIGVITIEKGQANEVRFEEGLEAKASWFVEIDQTANIVLLPQRVPITRYERRP